MVDRAHSRNRRFTWLRCTAVCPYRGTMMPSRGCPSLFLHQAKSTRGARLRRPVRKTILISLPRLRRHVRGKPRCVNDLRVWTEYERRAACDPSCAGGSGSPAPNELPCGPGNRACSRAGGFEACKSVPSYVLKTSRETYVESWFVVKVDFSFCGEYNLRALSPHPPAALTLDGKFGCKRVVAPTRSGAP